MKERTTNVLYKKLLHKCAQMFHAEDEFIVENGIMYYFQLYFSLGNLTIF